MDWLNYHHLLYFWVVAREGSIVRASQVLGLSHPTISAQIRALEEALGEDLFRRAGRRLILTEMGHVAFRYADEIFPVGRELLETMRGRRTDRAPRLRVGVVDVLSKTLVRRLLDPALDLDPPARILCREDRPETLMAALSQHALDVVLADTPTLPGTAVRAFHHLLGESEVAFFGRPALVSRVRRRFPACLQDLPMLLPTEPTILRRSIDSWLESIGVRPRIVGEFDDSALMKTFGQDGIGVFPALSVMTDALQKQHGVVPLGTVPTTRERFYAITVERRVKHPAVIAICEGARREVFARDASVPSHPDGGDAHGVRRRAGARRRVQ